MIFIIEEKYEKFNGENLVAFKDVNGKRIEIMELNDIKLEYEYTYNEFKAMGSRKIDYPKELSEIEATAEINYITNEGRKIIDNANYSLSFNLFKSGTEIQCRIEDIEEMEEGEVINFKIFF